MSLDALGNIGEFIGSIGVLVSLLYLAIQIKKNTETERSSTYHAIVSDFGQLNQFLASDPTLVNLYVRSLEAYEELDPYQKARISQIFYMTFRSFENMYYQYRKGYLDPEVWQGWERLMLNYFTRDGFQVWWRMRRDVFSEPFVVFVETTPISHPVPSYHDVTHTTAARTEAGST